MELLPDCKQHQLLHKTFVDRCNVHPMANLRSKQRYGCSRRLPLGSETIKFSTQYKLVRLKYDNKNVDMPSLFDKSNEGHILFHLKKGLKILTNWMIPHTEMINPHRDSFGPQIFISKFVGTII